MPFSYGSDIKFLGRHYSYNRLLYRLPISKSDLPRDCYEMFYSSVYPGSVSSARKMSSSVHFLLALLYTSMLHCSLTVFLGDNGKDTYIPCRSL